MNKIVAKISSMPPKMIIAYIVVLVALFLIVKFFVKPKVSQVFNDARYKIAGGKTSDGSSVKTISDNRKAMIAAAAKELYEAVYSWWGSAADRVTPLTKINALNDAEFIYAYESYMRQFSKNPYYDVSNEVMVSNEKDKFLTRAVALGLPTGKDAITPNDIKG